ncbi:MAG: hypothetical protein U0469_01685 [Candidatus Paceibacterota bacterium]|jgi:hypothetical protein
MKKGYFIQMLVLEHEFTSFGEMYNFDFNTIDWINWLNNENINQVFCEDEQQLKQFINQKINENCIAGPFVKAKGLKKLINRDYGDQIPTENMINDQIPKMIRDYLVGCIFKPDSSSTFGFLITEGIILEKKMYLLNHN